jgi:hypothetical protein
MAIDTAVNDLIAQLNSDTQAATNPEFLEKTKQMIVFLEACTSFRDPTFTDHARRRMLEFQGLLLSAHDFNSAAETNDPAVAFALAAPKEAALEAEQLNFEEVFTDTLCKFVRDRLALFHVNQPPSRLLDRHNGRLPYPLSLEFSTVLENVIRKHFANPILRSHNMKILASGISQKDMTEKYFKESFNLPKRENVVRTLWTSQWDIVKAAIRSQQGIQAEVGKSQQTLLGRIFLKKGEGAKGTVLSPAGSETASSLEIWAALTNKAGCKFDPPLPEEIEILDALFDYKPNTINKLKIAVEQLLHHDDSAQEGRKGSSRLYMSRMVMELPPHCGELIALWAYYEHNAIFSPKVLKAYLASTATSELARRAALPLFLRWVEDPIGRGEE